MIINKLLSYIVPVKIDQKESKINKNLEITWNNGHLVLDSLNTNFSYGSLQKVLKHGLKDIGFGRIKTKKSILVLGVAGGCVIKLLVNEIKFKGSITGIEIDPDTITLANQYFNLDQIPNVNIIMGDAQKFVKESKMTYDLVIIDVFEDCIMPCFLFEEDFMNNIKELLVQNGMVLFNTIVTNFNHQIRNNNYKKLVTTHFQDVRVISEIEGNNELFILKKGHENF
jgi:spermidine synthase